MKSECLFTGLLALLNCHYVLIFSFFITFLMFLLFFRVSQNPASRENWCGSLLFTFSRLINSAVTIQSGTIFPFLFVLYLFLFLNLFLFLSLFSVSVSLPFSLFPFSPRFTCLLFISSPSYSFASISISTF